MSDPRLEAALRRISLLEQQLAQTKPAMSQSEADAIRVAHQVGGYRNNEIASATKLNVDRYLNRFWFERPKSVISQILNSKSWIDGHDLPTHEIILGDCVEEMKALPSKGFDLVVTSPPYNAGKSYGDYDDHAGLETYLGFARAWLEEAARLVNDSGSIWVNLGFIIAGPNERVPLTYLHYPIIRDMDLHLVQEVVWHFRGGRPYKRAFANRTERWMWLSKNPDQCYFDLDAVRDRSLNRTRDARNNPLGKNPTDYWYFDHVNNLASEKTAHPCQFPVSMIERIIRACCPPKGRVLDPFGGSGSTGVAAANLLRSSTQIEQNPEFVRIIRDRLNQPIAVTRHHGGT